MKECRKLGYALRLCRNIEMVRGFASYPLHKMFSDKDLRPFGWLLDSLYKCREPSTNRPFFAKQSQFPRGLKMDVNLFIKKGLCKFVSKQRNLEF